MMSIVIVAAGGRFHIADTDQTICGVPLRTAASVAAFEFEPGSDFGAHVNDCPVCVKTAKTKGWIQ